MMLNFEGRSPAAEFVQWKDSEQERSHLQWVESAVATGFVFLTRFEERGDRPAAKSAYITVYVIDVTGNNLLSSKMGDKAMKLTASHQELISFLISIKSNKSRRIAFRSSMLCVS